MNLETSIAPLFNTVQMPSNPFQILLQLGDVNWYPGTENVAARGSALTTARQTLTAYELVAEVPWSYDLDEDGVIAMMEELRRSLLRNAREVIDDVLLNSDTTRTNNINADGATISPTDAGKAQWLLGFDGILHLPLVDNRGQANNHQAAVSDDMFNEVRAKLGKYGVRPLEVAYVCDINTYIRALSISNFRTLDKFGPQATVLTGQLGAVEGVPVIVSEQMRPADADGKVTDSGNTATTGRLLILNRTQVAGWVQARVGHRNGAGPTETPEHHGRQLPHRPPGTQRQQVVRHSYRVAVQHHRGLSPPCSPPGPASFQDFSVHQKSSANSALPAVH